jgi:ubiquinone biosynthesis protein
MLDWGFLIGESALASVLPDRYARYLRPLSGALAVFLGGLPEARQAAILAEQASLSLDASMAQRLALLARSCPALHKLGQLLARDRRLPPELRHYLQELESLPPTIPVEVIKAVLTRELGPLERLGVTLLPPALAEASVAVVIPYRQAGAPGARRPRQGVFKVLKPGVEERLQEDLGLLVRVGAHLDERCAEFGIPSLDYQELFQQIRETLRHEVRLDQEQIHLAQARVTYAAEPRVLVPALFEHCTPRVTAMEQVTGVKVTEHGLRSPDARNRLAGLVVEALIATPIFSRSAQALFHGDPHAGNLFLTADGRLALLDWSLAGTLGERERSAFVHVMLGALTFDADRIVVALAGLAERGCIDQPALESTVRSWLGRIRQGRCPGFLWLIGLFDDAVQTAGLRAGANVMLFRKTLHTLEGVLADIGAADDRIETVLLGQFLACLADEYPQRWLSPPTCRAFATRLSNADLAEAILGWPWTLTRFWLGQS